MIGVLPHERNFPYNHFLVKKKVSLVRNWLSKFCGTSHFSAKFGCVNGKNDCILGLFLKILLILVVFAETYHPSLAKFRRYHLAQFVLA